MPPLQLPSPLPPLLLPSLLPLLLLLLLALVVLSLLSMLLLLASHAAAGHQRVVVLEQWVTSAHTLHTSSAYGMASSSSGSEFHKLGGRKWTRVQVRSAWHGQ